MMSRKWCEEHNALQPIDRKKALEHPAVLEANGTGPFRLKERQPGVRTVLARHAGYWEAVESNVDEVVYTPIANDASRVAALLTGGVDVIEPVPLQAVDRLAAHPDVKLLQGPELRTVFLGLDQQRDELLYASVKGRNPFRDRRVRQAMSLAIDVEAIHRNLMRGASTPTALMVAPGVRGFQPDMNRRPPPDPQAALRLLAEAGYADGFEVDLNCPNDRYVNDAAICQAVASYLARVNIRVRVRTETKSIYQPRLLKRDTSFHIMCTPNERGQGQFNIGGYSNPRVDELAAKIQSETDPAARNGLIREAFRLHQEEVGHIPLHQQALIWGLARRVSLVQLPNDRMFFKWAVVQDERAQGR
jgi:peptide/nickel transport system substrate-binding protein